MNGLKSHTRILIWKGSSYLEANHRYSSVDKFFKLERVLMIANMVVILKLTIG